MTPAHSCRRRTLLVGQLVLSATFVAAAGAEDAGLAAGKAFVEQNCATCHAIGSSGASPHTDAPPFRTLSASYPVENLAEALAEGIMTGHPDMPTFELTPDQVAAVIDFLASIQEP